MFKNMKLTRATRWINWETTAETTAPHSSYSYVVTIVGYCYVVIIEVL